MTLTLDDFELIQRDYPEVIDELFMNAYSWFKKLRILKQMAIQEVAQQAEWDKLTKIKQVVKSEIIFWNRKMNEKEKSI